MTGKNDKLMNVLQGVEHYGSVSRAAQMLYISQPYASRLIATAEAELQVTLVERSARHAQLTEAGATYLAGLLKLEDEQARLLRQVRGLGASAVTEISLGYTETSTVPSMGALLHEYDRRYPQYRQTIRGLRSARAFQAMMDGKLDLYTGIAPATDQPLATQVLGHQAMSLIGPRRGRRPHGGIDSPRQLEFLDNQPFIMYQPVSVLDRLVRHWLMDGGVTPLVKAQLTGLREVVQVASALGCWAIVPDQAALADLPDTMVRLPIRDPQMRLPVIVAAREQDATRPAVAAFMQLAGTVSGLGEPVDAPIVRVM